MSLSRPDLDDTSRLQCPLWVKSRHSASLGRCPLYPQKQTLESSHEMSALCQKRTSGHPYSITSSARASSDDGTSRPRAFAVLRLMTRSYLFGACTGSSAGFAPL